eukprot:CAMPEP_0118856100 /NCGR_PEP_ID=MMETSP1163-20130328/3705_1 /TAXON_ID=124430 /ORGANISM="Phaeomonas parva, Strain CCMP2877" /LENGTH=65 /DNA_ID=CAMNT_0006789137 /DNA_START=1 /DNA_END=198 /DNA_ORIENTATION=-
MSDRQLVYALVVVILLLAYLLVRNTLGMWRIEKALADHNVLKEAMLEELRRLNDNHAHGHGHGGK